MVGVARRAALDARRRLKMARSAHAYVRGSTERFYDWLDGASGRRLAQGPSIWICGDCHVGNLGPTGAPSGEPAIELRDLDQTVIGNPAYDLVRLALSLAMAARGSDLPGVTTARITEDLIHGYERAFAGDEPPTELGDLPAPIRVVMKRAMRRTWKHLSRDRLGEDVERRLPIGKRFWRLDHDERAAIEALAREDAVRALITKLDGRDDAAEIALLDAAYWVKGCSSLGLWRGAMLLELRHGGGRKKKRSICLLDVKEAVDAFPPQRRVAGMPDDPGERVVAGARALAPALGERMVATHLLDRSVFVRELLPQDLKVELDRLSTDDARAVAHYLGMVVGRAHGRQMDAATRRAWREEIERHHPKDLDAPSWLWNALLELVPAHEHAYLEHCRKYALATRAA
jgi:uncharacterized protein (DUF2252 family)